ncbi:MAG: non-canonical purine NTP pyrophosphatase [Patescibacteria group bacterium]
MELYFVTGNEDKVKDVEAVLGFPIKSVRLNLPEIQSLDIEEIVKAKVQSAFELVKKPVFVDDSGFYITAWNGFPGPFIKYILSSGGNDLLLRMMETEENREVMVNSAIGFHDGEQVYTFVGEAKGVLVVESRGKSWGWEPIFQPLYQKQTYAEMTREYKNSISMRRVALEKFKRHLQLES